MAKTDEAHTGLAAQIAVHSFKREYEGVVWGAFSEQSGEIDRPVERSARDRKKMAITDTGKRAVTDYRTIGVYSGKNATYSHMRFELKTGRTHQIRVHCASAGHPIAGDGVYGKADRDKKYFPGLEGQCLHAACIGFRHPVTGEYLEFNAPYPEYFEEVLTTLEHWDRIL